MNDLDNEIRRAFDELVNAAPPPPSAPNSVVAFRADPDPRTPRLLAAAASVVLVAAVGMITYTQRTGRSETVATSERTAPSASVATPPPVQTEPPLIRDETGGSPEPATSVESADVEEYEVVPAPWLPGTTEPVPLQGVAYDGVYFAYLHEGPGPEDPRALRFDVLQAFSGQDCLDRFGNDGPGICTPFGIATDSTTGRLDLGVDGTVVTVRDVNSTANYRISGTELLSIINGEPPASSAPDGYGFSGGFGFLLTFDHGTLTRIDQPGDAYTAQQ